MYLNISKMKTEEELRKIKEDFVKSFNARGKELLELRNRLMRIEELIAHFIDDKNEKELSLILQIVRGESH